MVLSAKCIIIQNTGAFSSEICNNYKETLHTYYRICIFVQPKNKAMKQNDTRYEEWLVTLANTRLVFNTIEELEDMLDNHSIHNNGVKRCFSTPQKLRAAYRDLKVEVDEMTDGVLNLDKVLMLYQKTWAFFRENLYRRSNPECLALDLLSYVYPPYIKDIGGKKSEIFEQVIEQGISVPLLVLMLMKAIPGYDSKDGDVVDMPEKYEKVIMLMEKFTNDGTMFNGLPFISRAREEKNKTRIMLLYYVSCILDIFESYADDELIYDTSNIVKESCVNLDIAGFWNECGGKLLYTDFWQIEEALADGSYFMTYWHKDAENHLTGIRYSLFVCEGDDGKLVFYVIHPEAIKHRMNGQKYGDVDHAWYQTEMLDDCPSVIPLQRLMYSNKWSGSINLTRCVDDDVVNQYDKWLNHECEIIKPFQHLEYKFFPDIYAITRTHIYIPSENDGEYYKVPKSAYEGFDRIQLGDNVGTMIMNEKVYLAFDEFLLYIGTSKKELKSYGIERVNCIE